MTPDFALYGKRILEVNQENRAAFEETVEIRVAEACARMGLRRNQFRIRCFSSIEKESFMMHSGDDMCVYMDKHQMDQLFMLTFLFSIYGQMDIKSGIYTAMLSGFPYFRMRICDSLLLLQAERSFMRSDLFRAQQYLDARQEYDAMTEYEKAFQEDALKGEFLSALICKVGHRQDACISIAVSFFVFHELAHVKYNTSPENMTYYRLAVEAVQNALDRPYSNILKRFGSMKPKISLEEYVCDTYALYLLFDYIHEKSGSYESGQVLDSYFASVVNLALIGCEEGDAVLLSDKSYLHAADRAIHVIQSLLLLWTAEERPDKDIKAVYNSLQYAYEKYRNYMKNMNRTWDALYCSLPAPKSATLKDSEREKLTEELMERFSAVI